MRSFSFIALAVATLSLAACARKDILPPGDPFADKPWVIDETLPVPIRFGKGDLFQIETKGTETALTSLAGKKVAITALTSFTEVRDSTPDKKTMLFNGDIATVAAGGNVSFDVGNHYYPMPGQEDTVRNYSFYAYRITTDGKDAKKPLIGKSGSLNDYIDFDLNPETNNVDVLWAKALAEDYSGGLQGFNARYIRAVTAAGEAAKAKFYPKFAFTHSAAAIRFMVKSAVGTTQSDYEKADKDACDFTIDSITVGGIYNNVRLSLATGALAKADSSDVAAAFRQYPAAAVVPAPGPVNFGNDLFILPGSDPKTISVHFTDKEGTPGATSSSNLSVPPGGYVAGHIYTYTIVIASPVQMSISATLGDWTENDMGNVSVFQ